MSEENLQQKQEVLPFTWDYRKTTKLQQYTSGKVKKTVNGRKQKQSEEHISLFSQQPKPKAS